MYNTKNYSKESLINHGRSNVLNEAGGAAYDSIHYKKEQAKKAEAAKRSNNLSVGSKGAKVEALQVKLGIKDDGDFGAGTKAAVIKFQEENGLKGDGIVGPKTRAALNNPKAKKKKEDTKPAAKPAVKTDVKTAVKPAVKTPDVKNAAPKKKKTYDELKAEAKLAKKSEREERRAGRKTKRSNRRNTKDLAKNKEKQEKLKAELAELSKEAENFASLGESRVLNFSEFSKING